MNNLAYFRYSQLNNDDILDFSNPEGNLVISKSSVKSETSLMTANHRLIDLITIYKNLTSSKPVSKESVNRVVDEIIYIIENTKLINYSPFCIYFQVFGYSYSAYMDEKDSMQLEEKRKLLKKILDLYIKNRHGLYMHHGYSDLVLQVNADLASSRRKGKAGIERMEAILLPRGFIRASSIIELRGLRYCYLLPDKGDTKLFDSFLKKNGIKFEFRKSRDNKNPDMLLKINNDYFIIEHKLTNGGGGSQNAEINEIIQFINYDESLGNWHYLSCLQGNYFRKINKSSREPKATGQYLNIFNNLRNHQNNFFVNGKGFEKLITDLTSERNVMEFVNNVNDMVGK